VPAAVVLIAPNTVRHFPGGRGSLRASTRAGRNLGVPGQGDGADRRDVHLEHKDVLASETRAAFLFRGTGAREGRPLDNPTCLVVEVRDGKIVRFDEFVWDDCAAFWA
jgi:ketosteroid isomerase-like protein